MSWTHKQRATVVAIVVLLVSVPMLWQLSQVRATQASDDQQIETVSDPVPARQTANDYDGDSIPDGSDDCPTRPGTENGLQDNDGCPDVVATTGAS
jgi:hypothetical protein